MRQSDINRQIVRFRLTDAYNTKLLVHLNKKKKKIYFKNGESPTAVIE